LSAVWGGRRKDYNTFLLRKKGCWGLHDSSFWTKPLKPWKRSFHKEKRMQGNIKMSVPAGINEDTDASVEPRRGRISSFLLAPLPGKRKSRKKQTNPNIQKQSE